MGHAILEQWCLKKNTAQCPALNNTFNGSNDADGEAKAD